MKRFFYLTIFLCLANSIAFCQSPVRQIQLINFDLQSSAVIKDNGSTLSTANYSSSNYWFQVKVPCTVLSGLVANKVYPDPYVGMNNMLIPDASDSFNHQYHLEHDPTDGRSPGGAGRTL